MAKRFTETEKWRDPWFCGLNAQEKLFWIFLIDNCDHAGIWKVNWPLVKFYLPDIEPQLPQAFAGRIIEINKEKWFIEKFIEFQYGTLNPENRVHHSILAILEKEGAYKPRTSPLLGAKDKDKDILLGCTSKDNKISISKKCISKVFVPPSLEDVVKYCAERKNSIDPVRFYDTNTARGWVDKNRVPYKDWKAVVRTWENWDKDKTIKNSVSSKLPAPYVEE